MLCFYCLIHYNFQEATRPQPNAGQHEDKIRSLKQKLVADRESSKKVIVCRKRIIRNDE